MSYASLGRTLSSGTSAKVGGTTVAGSKTPPPIPLFFGAKKPTPAQCAPLEYWDSEFGGCLKVEQPVTYVPTKQDPASNDKVLQLISLLTALAPCCNKEGTVCDKCQDGTPAFDAVVAEMKKLTPEQRAVFRAKIRDDQKTPAAAKALMLRALDAADGVASPQAQQAGTPTWQYALAGGIGIVALAGVAYALTRTK